MVALWQRPRGTYSRRPVDKEQGILTSLAVRDALSIVEMWGEIKRQKAADQRSAVTNS